MSGLGKNYEERYNSEGELRGNSGGRGHQKCVLMQNRKTQKDSEGSNLPIGCFGLKKNGGGASPKARRLWGGVARPTKKPQVVDPENEKNI